VFEVDYYELDPPEVPAFFISPSEDDCAATLPNASPPPPPAPVIFNPTDVNASIEGLIQVGINVSGTSASGRRLGELMAEGVGLWRSRPQSDTLPEVYSHVRRMWGAATAATSNELWHAADGSYVDTDTSGRYTDWAECKASNANAQVCAAHIPRPRGSDVLASANWRLYRYHAQCGCVCLLSSTGSATTEAAT
jgi:hypothetical protein